MSTFDRQELRNALDQARREIGNRYDLKDTNTVIDEGDNEITITTASEYSLTASKDVMESKLIGRKLSLKIQLLDNGPGLHEPVRIDRHRHAGLQPKERCPLRLAGR